MKDFVLWIMVICLLIGIPMFFLGQFIEKTVHLLWLFGSNKAESKLGDRLFWCGLGMFAIGLVLALWVYPNL